jgi:hypothetical protein
MRLISVLDLRCMGLVGRKRCTNPDRSLREAFLQERSAVVMLYANGGSLAILRRHERTDPGHDTQQRTLQTEYRMRLEGDRVRRHTAAAVLRRIDDETVVRLKDYADAGAEAISVRLQALDREWDTDRIIEAEAATTGLLGLALGVLWRRSLLAIPACVGGALMLHALIGWYPLLPLLRRQRLRTAREIARERYALKALRGDFADMEQPTDFGAARPVSTSAEAAPF